MSLSLLFFLLFPLMLGSHVLLWAHIAYDGIDQISEIESLRHVKGIEYHHVKCHRVCVVIKYYNISQQYTI
jgi:hypothetical protein